MDIVTFIKSINIVAIIIFFLTGFSLAYELYLFFKQEKSKKAPKIPALEGMPSPRFQKKLTVVSAHEEKSLFKKPNYIAISILIAILAVFGGFFVFQSLSRTNLTQTTNVLIHSSPQPTQTIASEGIVFYSPDWKKQDKSHLRFSKAGDKIIIGLKNLPQSDIEKARIRVNSSAWSDAHETTSFNAQFDVFYQEYTIASDDARLTIEAQLYSKRDGWLGEQ